MGRQRKGKGKERKGPVRKMKIFEDSVSWLISFRVKQAKSTVAKVVGLP